MPVTKKQAATVGIPAALVIAGAVAFMVTRQTYQGTIDASGYHPPAGVTVQWKHPSYVPVYKKLNEAQPCPNVVRHPCYERFGENDPALSGWQPVPAMTGEAVGGTVYATLVELFRQNGITRLPTWEEQYDLGVANSDGSDVWGCRQYEALTGNRNDPSCTPVPTPTPTATSTPTPAPTPTPTASPSPTATPCPTCPPVPTPCPPFSQGDNQAIDCMNKMRAGTWPAAKMPNCAARWQQELANRAKGSLKGCQMVPSSVPGSWTP